MKKYKKPDTLAVINNYNFCDIHTDRRTWLLYDQPGQEGRVGEKSFVSTHPQITRPDSTLHCPYF